MYSTTELLVNGKKTDFSQLGWVAAWVLEDSAEDYHKRKLAKQPESIQQNGFIASLITEGVFKEALIKNLPRTCTSETVQSVLQARSAND